jgi:hypothetical protein
MTSLTMLALLASAAAVVGGGRGVMAAVQYGMPGIERS